MPGVALSRRPAPSEASGAIVREGGEEILPALPPGTVRAAVRPMVIDVARSATEAARELPELARAVVRLLDATAKWLERDRRDGERDDTSR